MLSVYPNVNLVIENRAGSLYRGGYFILSKTAHVSTFCQALKSANLKLGIVLDFPQLLTAEHIDTINFDSVKYLACIESLMQYRKYIKGIHMWGKKKNDNGRWVAHTGTLDTFFDNNEVNKNIFVNGVKTLCDDNLPRFFVPEVNSGASDLLEIVNSFF